MKTIIKTTADVFTRVSEMTFGIANQIFVPSRPEFKTPCYLRVIANSNSAINGRFSQKTH
jgi:hypothetical protein